MYEWHVARVSILWNDVRPPNATRLNRNRHIIRVSHRDGGVLASPMAESRGVAAAYSAYFFPNAACRIGLHHIEDHINHLSLK